jgi:hypothetical protein
MLEGRRKRPERKRRMPERRWRRRFERRRRRRLRERRPWWWHDGSMRAKAPRMSELRKWSSNGDLRALPPPASYIYVNLCQ